LDQNKERENEQTQEETNKSVENYLTNGNDFIIVSKPNEKGILIL
jgi:hypothetical protein